MCTEERVVAKVDEEFCWSQLTIKLGRMLSTKHLILLRGKILSICIFLRIGRSLWKIYLDILLDTCQEKNSYKNKFDYTYSILCSIVILIEWMIYEHIYVHSKRVRKY